MNVEELVDFVKVNDKLALNMMFTSFFVVGAYEVDGEICVYDHENIYK